MRNFQYQSESDGREDGRLQIRQLAMNVLSIHMTKGLYVLAYRKLHLDVKQRALKPEEEITICTEFGIKEERGRRPVELVTKQSIRRFLDGDEYELLADFEANQERIKDCIMRRMPRGSCNVDDMPYIIGLEADIALDLHKEYQAVMKLYRKKGSAGADPGLFRRSAGAAQKDGRLSDCADQPADQHGPAACDSQRHEISCGVYSGTAGHGEDEHDHQYHCDGLL